MGKLLPLPRAAVQPAQELLRGRILDGVYPPLSRMPSENELGKAFDVSRITVRQALGDLQKEGLIFKIHGRAPSSPGRRRSRTSAPQGLGESMTQMGYEVINRLHGLRYVPAGARVAERLRVEEGSPVCEIKRVRLVNREPVSLEVTYLPQALGERLEKADLVTRDIFLILENDCGIPLGHADLAIDAVLADADLTRALAVEEGAPIMRIERLTHAADGAPLDFEYLYYRGDAFQYRLRIDRQKGERA